MFELALQWRKQLFICQWYINFCKFKAKDSEIAVTPLCLGNISNDWSVDNMKKTRFDGYVYDFSADYGATDVDDIKDIHKYLMKKNDIV